MKRVDYPAPVRALIGELKRMPGIGPRSAERIALWMLQKRDARADDIAASIRTAVAQVRNCPLCGFFACDDRCDFCADDQRDPTRLCVVEQPTDMLPLERSGAYRGRYHALGGKLSPLDHVGPEHLRIPQLVERIQNESPTEVILALGADVEGEATASYLAEVLSGFSISISRIAQGLPAGGGLDEAGELTLLRALTGRTSMRAV